jgi:hypothetical protein
MFKVKRNFPKLSTPVTQNAVKIVSAIFPVMFALSPSLSASRTHCKEKSQNQAICKYRFHFPDLRNLR